MALLFSYFSFRFYIFHKIEGVYHILRTLGLILQFVSLNTEILILQVTRIIHVYESANWEGILFKLFKFTLGFQLFTA